MSSTPRRTIAIIGGGPAGLRAAEVAAASGAFVTVFDAKPSVGRKFLVAGKSGLNITNSADFEPFVAQYSGKDLPAAQWRKHLADFDNTAMDQWARSLGINTSATGGGKVFPETKKAAPILRRWVQRLREMGVDFQMNHKWLDLRQQGEQIELEVECKEGVFNQDFDAVILAMGGASWPKTGSNGQWVTILEEHDITVETLQSANCGWECAEVVKSCRIPLSGARPIDEVISTSGGVAWSELDENLMLKKLPNVYCAGEMIDWEAPTGGFLMQGCFATGSAAGKAASATQS